MTQAMSWREDRCAHGFLLPAAVAWREACGGYGTRRGHERNARGLVFVLTILTLRRVTRNSALLQRKIGKNLRKGEQLLFRQHGEYSRAYS
jgi:hypothetical protein